MSLGKKFYKYMVTYWMYKVFALVLAVPLWLNFVGQADAVLVKDVEVLFVTSKGLSIVKSDVPKIVNIKLSGPRTLLSRLHTNPLSLTLDLTNMRKGRRQIKVEATSLDLPIGVKVVEIEPSVIDIWLIPAPFVE